MTSARALWPVLPMLPLALAACPSDSGNPAVLWLGPKNGETQVQLLDHEPPKY